MEERETVEINLGTEQHQEPTKEMTVSELKDETKKEIMEQPDTPVGFESSAAFSAIQKIGIMFATSSMVPDTYSANTPDPQKRKVAIANATIAVEMAMRLRMSPLLCMHNMYVVHGRPAWSSAALISFFNTCGRYSSLGYHMIDKEGNELTPGKPAWGCYCDAIEKSTGRTLYGPLASIDMAKAEGWWSKKDKKTGRETSKWQTMTELMLRYRAAAFFIRNYAPELSMGLYTEEEAEDIDMSKDVLGQPAYGTEEYWANVQKQANEKAEKEEQELEAEYCGPGYIDSEGTT